MYEALQLTNLRRILNHSKKETSQSHEVESVPSFSLCGVTVHTTYHIYHVTHERRNEYFSRRSSCYWCETTVSDQWPVLLHPPWQKYSCDTWPEQPNACNNASVGCPTRLKERSRDLPNIALASTVPPAASCSTQGHHIPSIFQPFIDGVST